MKNQKKTSRQLQAEKTKATIFAKAKELLSIKTLDEITINEICKEANVSVGAFYHHFESKSGVIIEIYHEIDIRFKNEVLPSLQEEEPIEAIHMYLEAQGKEVLNGGLDIVKNLYKAQIYYGSQFYLSPERGLPHGLLILIENAMKAKKINTKFPAEDIMNDLLVISRGSIYNWCVSDGKVDLLHMIRRLSSDYLYSHRIID